MARRIAALILAVVALQALLVTGAAADEHDNPETPSSATFDIAPVGERGTYFTLTMEPGESRALTVEISNRGEAPGEALTYRADAYTMPNGRFTAREYGEPETKEATAWVNYEEQRVELGPEEGYQRSFAVNVPEDATPGEYMASLVVQNAEPTGGAEEGISIKQVQRRAIAVFITIPGDLAPELAINDFTHALKGSGSSQVDIAVTNAGTKMTKPEGTFFLWDEDGEELLEHPVSLGTWYAGDTAPVAIYFDRALLPGNYTAQLDLTYDNGERSVSSGQVLLVVEEPPPPPTRENESSGPARVVQDARDAVFGSDGGGPWAPLLGGLSLGLLGVAGFLGFRKRRSRRLYTTPQRAEAPAASQPDRDVPGFTPVIHDETRMRGQRARR